MFKRFNVKRQSKSVRDESLDLIRKEWIDYLTIMSEKKEQFKDVNPNHTPAIKLNGAFYRDLIKLSSIKKLSSVVLDNGTNNMLLTILDMPVILDSSINYEGFTITSYEEYTLERGDAIH